MDTFEGYRMKHLTDLEREAYRNLHRAVVMNQDEGGARIDTRYHGCSGDCDQGRKPCDSQVCNSQMPSPLDPQPVQIAKPSRLARWWKRVQDWWIGDEE